MLSGRGFQQMLGITMGRMGTNCALLLADLVWTKLKKNDQTLARSFNFMFCYVDHVLSLNHSKFGGYVDRPNLTELEINDTTNTVMSASYLHLHFDIDSEVLLKVTL